MQPPQPPAEGPQPIVSVRTIKPIGGGLYAVSLRTQAGRVVTMIIPARLASTAYVALAAEVVAALAELNRL